MTRYVFSVLAASLVLAASTTPLRAQDMGNMSDSDYMAKMMTAAPPAVVKGATIIVMNKDGSVRTLQAGTNGFTCLMMGPDPGCADQNAMAWAKAYLSHSTPPPGVGFVYMLAGDNGASNTDPWALAQTATNHWVKTGPHVMILGTPAGTMGYPMTPDPDPSKPYVMWPNTPYAHLMIPVSTTP
ncbi:MAG: hypothetical protein JOY69_00205 [Candidatus Eremiobacteraeota bacterium]|nr:hypothetical protein [Candidatus Eremiobacteraeota bacterium]MBV8371656.1 hypothetical protein [Candidatus Eremiobacteraeota bacterium]